MSLINDAMKTAQRERAGRAESGKDQQPLIDGFFPYVSTGPSRSRSKLFPALVVGAGAVALVVLVGWFALTKSSKPVAEVKPPVTVPSRTATRPRDVVTVPVVPHGDGTAKLAPNTTPATTASPTQTATGSEQQQLPIQRPAQSASAPQSGARTEVRNAHTDTTVAPVITEARRSPVVPVQLPRPRIDYEGQATALFNAGDLAGARDKFLLATRNAPTARAWTNYGVTLQKLGDMTGAAAAYQSAIGVDANYLEAWLYQGRLATLLGDVARAVPLFHRARAINPRNADVNVELAYLEYEAKNFAESRRFADDAIRADASNARAHWFLAVSADQLKDFETATREYAAYLQTIGPAAPDQAVNVGFARQRLAELRGKP